MNPAHAILRMRHRGIPLDGFLIRLHGVVVVLGVKADVPLANVVVRCRASWWCGLSSDARAFLDCRSRGLGSGFNYNVTAATSAGSGAAGCSASACVVLR